MEYILGGIAVIIVSIAVMIWISRKRPEDEI